MKLSCLIILLILHAGIATADSIHVDQQKEPATEDAFSGSVRFFQKFLSAADGERCPMTPSCSAYALNATRKNGILMGWIMACDRLLRCGGDELKRCTPKKTKSGALCTDPVENNDFWWK
jgi:putative component of membrane protein insertase Oxa1/YidC/SpoIIIJ protein YidD